MSSAEPLFDEERDAWWDLDLVRKRVMLRRRPFEKHGDAERWLTQCGQRGDSCRPPFDRACACTGKKNDQTSETGQSRPQHNAPAALLIPATYHL
jgi:hypothetical protein